MKKRAIIGCLMIILLTAASARSRCGTDRWAIKTCTDEQAKQIKTHKDTTIKEIQAWPYPFPSKFEYPEGADKKRVAPYELTIWTIDARITKYRMMPDGDIHVILADEAGNTLVAEIPVLECVKKEECPFLPQLTEVRDAFDKKFAPSTEEKEANVKVRISGVGLFARLFGKTEKSEMNLRQLHPITEIKYN